MEGVSPVTFISHAVKRRLKSKGLLPLSIEFKTTELGDDSIYLDI